MATLEYELKMKQFEKDIQNEKAMYKKLKILFLNEYEEIIGDILNLKEQLFIDQVKEGVFLQLEDFYTDGCLSNNKLSKLVETIINEIKNKYEHDFSLIDKAWQSYEKTSKRRLNNDIYLSGFRKHCIHTDELAFHNCCTNEKDKEKNCHFINVYNSDSKEEINFVICENCKKVYYSTFILAHCFKCKVDYYTSLLSKEENPELLLATWENYHCPQLINEKMKCIKCHDFFYVNMKTGLLNCLNKKCEFISKPTRILWTCSTCKADFKSGAIPYNPLDIQVTKKLVTQTLLLKHKAHPRKMPCCKLNVFFTDFYHKKNCDGILYESELDDNVIIVCEKCKAINYYDRINWTCPKCGKRFKDSIIPSSPNIHKFEHKISQRISEEKVFKMEKEKEYNSKKLFTPKPMQYSTRNLGLKKEKELKGFSLNSNEKYKVIIGDKEKEKEKNKEEEREKEKEYRSPRKELNRKFWSKKLSNIHLAQDKDDKDKEKEDEKDKNNEKNKENKNKEDHQKDNNNHENNNEENKDNFKINRSKTNYIKDKKQDEPNRRIFKRFRASDREKREREEKERRELEEKEEREKKEEKERKRKEREEKKERERKEREEKEREEKEKEREEKEREEKEKEEKEKEEKEKEKKDGFSPVKIKGEKTNSIGMGWFRRRQKRLEKENLAKTEKKEKNENLTKSKKKEKEEENLDNEEESEENNFLDNNDYKELHFGSNDSDEDENENEKEMKENPVEPDNLFLNYKFKRNENKRKTKGMEIKEDIDEFNKDDEKGKNIKKKNAPQIKISMTKVPGISDHLFNHINKRMNAILNRCKVPIFNIEDYTFNRKLGEGSYAIIYSVHKNNDKTQKKYALKKIIAKTLTEIDKYTKEFELVHCCAHPNIMKIYGICIRMLDQTTYALYVLMELSRCDWDKEIKMHLMKKQNYSENELINILRQLTGALLYMQQSEKISHRDIKPQNVLLFEDGIYKIADFGEAKEAKLSKQVNTLRGTELYMSPALYSGLKNEKDDVNHDPYKSDVFSLGFCFLYAAVLDLELLYQMRDINNSKKINDVLQQHLERKYSQTFINVLSHMMEIEESERFDFLQLINFINENYDKEGNLMNEEKTKNNEKKPERSLRGSSRKHK